MNLKICKKCLKKKTLGFNLYKYNLGGVFVHFINFNGKNYCRYLKSDDIYKKKDLLLWEKYPEKYCHVEEGCPYYMEHMLSEWNKENES